MRKLLPIIMFLISFEAGAQDPHFSQFYSAPLTVNPAYTGTFTGDLRIMSNARQQWVSSSSPYNTYTIAMDGKVGGRLEGQNPFNLGMMFMSDNSLNGALKSLYATGSASYHVPLDEDGFQSIGLGLSGTYGNRTINFSEITFSNQYSNEAFNLTIPSGETALMNMKPFVSVGAGLLYQYTNGENGNFFDIGVSGYHFNKPKQTSTQDNLQFIPVRISIQSSFIKYLSDKTLINVKALYQHQANTSYLQGGMSIEKLIGADLKHLIGAGLWYRSADAITPNIRLGIDKLMIGLSYDVTMSSLKSSPDPTKSWELSFRYTVGQREQ